MASKDVTSVFGSTRFVLPLILIFFIGAGSAIACPKHKARPHTAQNHLIHERSPI